LSEHAFILQIKVNLEYICPYCFLGEVVLEQAHPDTWKSAYEA